MKSKILLALALLAALPAARTAADVGPPVHVTMTPPPPGVYPVEGQTYTATVQITSAVDAMVGEFTLESERAPGGAGGEYWQMTSVSVPPGVRIPVQANVPLDVTYEAVPADPTQPVTIVFLFNDQTYKQRLRLIPRLFGLAKSGARESAPMEPGSDLESFPGVNAEMARPEPSAAPTVREVPNGTPDNDEPRASNGPQAPQGYNVRFVGRFVYWRSDGNKVGADGVSVHVWESDTGYLEHMAAQATDAWGYFDITFWYDQSEEPDFLLEFLASNSRVTVEDVDVWETTWGWETGKLEDWNGTYRNWGERHPADSDDYPSLHIQTTGTRAWRWYNDLGYDTPSVDYHWPDDASNSWYNPVWESIHINIGKQWRETTIAHEYSHHWVNRFGEDDGDDYCNSPARCDNNGDCGHCMWCQESPGDAWQEGFPNWMCDHLTRSLEGLYGFGALDTRDEEDVQTCQQTGMLDDPWQDEGHFGALLRDIEDGGNDDEDSYGTGIDELSLGRDEIVWIAASVEPTTPSGFISAFRNQYPGFKAQLWATAANNGFQLSDNTDPSNVSGLGSPSHQIGVTSPDATIQYTWNAATDDFSGIGGYSLLVSQNAAADPGFTQDMGAFTIYQTDDLAPGFYYFNIRAVDRAGNWANGYVSFGPIEIREPYPADLDVDHPSTGWEFPLIPRALSNSTYSSCPTPTVLFGNSSSTYWNVAYTNVGELSATGNWINRVYLDGVNLGDASIFSPLGAGSTTVRINQGPVTVRGGRHMLSTHADSPEQHAEMSETNNRYARQWIWQPYNLPANFSFERNAPPDCEGGAGNVAWWYSCNCDGLTATQSAAHYMYVVVVSTDGAADYDCRLHPHSSGAENGFTLLDAVGSSYRPVGCVDAVFVRSDNAGAATWDVGVLNYDGASSTYDVHMRTAPAMTLGSPVVLSISENEYLEMREVQVTTAGTYTVEADIDTAAGTVQMIYLDNTFTTGGLLAYDAYDITDENGHMEITFTAAAGTWHGFAFYRDPKDVPPAKAAAAVSVTVNVTPTPGDLEPVTPGGWYSAFVPRPAADGTPSSVPAPSSLTGNGASTYYNYAVRNDGPNATGSFEARFYLDGTPDAASVPYAAIPANTTRFTNSPTPRTIAGGRHTLSYWMDEDGVVGETNEMNNHFGLQWVWSPLQLAAGVPVTRSSPGDPTGGWDHVVEGGQQVSLYNCDGLRTPAPAPAGQNGWWQATATMPGAASDVDPRLHDVVSGVFGGFNIVRAISGWSEGASDFVLANFRATAVRQFDVGIVKNTGTESYSVHAVSSSFIATNPSGTFGPYGIGSGLILNLHEVYLPAGPVAIGLLPQTGTVDWGFSLHEPNLAYQSKSVTLSSGIAWMQGDGLEEWMTVNAPVAGYYCLAVWKAGTADLAKSGSYKLIFLPGVTDTPEHVDAPAATALSSIRPNPFNPRTTIGFDLARSGPVRLQIFGVDGRLVRTLVTGVRDAGQGEASWDGHDDTGRAVPSGVYIARLEASGVVDRKKLILLK